MIFLNRYRLLCFGISANDFLLIACLPPRLPRSDRLFGEVALARDTLKSTDNHHRVDPKHPEGIVEDIVHALTFLWFIDHKAIKVTVRIHFVDIDRRVDNMILERGEVAGQFK